MAWAPSNERDRQPRFGKLARAWFFRSVCYHLPAEYQKHRMGDQEFPEVDVEKFAAALLESPELYVEWVPEDGYAGSGYRAGEWRVRWPSVVIALQRGAHVFAPEISLEEWLRRDLKGFVPEGPGEPHMLNLLNRVTRRGGYPAMRALRARQARWPRLCASCGDEFRGRRHTDKHCPACIAVRKKGQRA